MRVAPEKFEVARQLLADYLTKLRDGIADLAVGGTAAGLAATAVRDACTTVGSDVSVSLPDGSSLIGRATGIDDEGRLVVDAAGVARVVSAGDVVHVR